MTEEEINVWQTKISASSVRAKEAIAFWLSVSRHKVEIETVVDARV